MQCNVFYHLEHCSESWLNLSPEASKGKKVSELYQVWKTRLIVIHIFIEYRIQKLKVKGRKWVLLSLQPETLSNSEVYTPDMATARMFPCTLCTYSSTTASHLKRHKRIHSGEKPFMCEQCEYSLVNLQFHLRSQIGIIQRIWLPTLPTLCNLWTINE